MTEQERSEDRARQEAIENLTAAIAALETQRTALGNAVVDASIVALRRELTDLEAPSRRSASAGQDVISVRRQRKQVTILFSNVPGFTAMSETVDAEEVSEMMNALWTRLDQVIADHGGSVDKHLGDGVMAVWGAQTSREDDPELAIRAALAMQAELAGFCADRRVELAMRTGINTGLALLGEVGTTGEYTAMGDAVNTASRLERAASAGAVLISHDTYRHVRGVFDVQPLEPIRMKGKAEPVQAYVVQRAKPRAFRMDRRGVEGIETRMIGRDTELQILQDTMRVVMGNGERRMVTIVGEAGVGKSRLLDEFDDWIEFMPELIRYFAGRAVLTLQHQPYSLLRDVISFRFQIQDSDRVLDVRQKMEAGVAEALGADEQAQMRAHFIGQLLGFDFGDSPHLRGVLNDAQQLRDRALIYLGDFFRAMTSQYPVVIFLEDIHWADDSSLDAIDYLARTLAGCPLFIVCLARPTLLERRPHWGEGQPFHTRLELQPLSKSNTHRLLGEILQKVTDVPVTLSELVVGGAEGNPFFVEELTKMLIEDGVIVKGADHWHVEPDRLTAVRVPPTLTGVIQARLDSLSLSERMVLQQASVVGRTFWDSAVVHINGATRADGAFSEGETLEALAGLDGKEMVFRRDTSAFASAQEYRFKHAILREVTYEGVLRRVRRQYHGLIADWLVEQGGDRLAEYTGLIADHLELAGRTEQAVTYLRRAGDQAAGQFANAEAVGYFSRALDLLAETDAERAARYELLMARERVYDVLGAREAQSRDLAALEELIDTMGGGASAAQQRAQVALRQANYAQVTSDYPSAIAATQAVIEQAQVAQDVSLQAAGYLQWGLGLWRLGDFEACGARLEQALTLAREAGARLAEAESLRILGNVHYYQGDYGRAAAYWKKSLPISREIHDRPGEASALSNLGEAARSQGDYAGARAYYEQRLHICREVGDRWGEVIAVLNLGLVAHNLGDDELSEGYSQQVLRLAYEIDSRLHQGYAQTNLGHALMGQGRLAEATEAYGRAVALHREMGGHHLALEAVAGLARAALAQGDLVQAQVHAEEILDYLSRGHTLDGTEEPMRVYLACYRALEANGDPRARAVLDTAHGLLQEWAARITDADLRRSFLENVAAHCEIAREFIAREFARDLAATQGQ